MILRQQLSGGSTSHLKYQSIIGSRHNHLHTKNKIELWENNNTNRIFIGHLYISVLQGSRMAETSNRT